MPPTTGGSDRQPFYTMFWQVSDIFDASYREDLKRFFAENVNRFVTAFRPCRERIADDTQRP
jgi:hypothetical protein